MTSWQSGRVSMSAARSGARCRNLFDTFFYCRRHVNSPYVILGPRRRRSRNASSSLSSQPLVIGPLIGGVTHVSTHARLIAVGRPGAERRVFWLSRKFLET